MLVKGILCNSFVVFGVCFFLRLTSCISQTIFWFTSLTQAHPRVNCCLLKSLSLHAFGVHCGYVVRCFHRSQDPWSLDDI